jgi:hypothetical protein
MRAKPVLRLVVGVLTVLMALVGCDPGLADMRDTMTFTNEETGIDVDILVNYTNLGQRADIARDGTVVKGRLVSVMGDVERDDSTNEITLNTATIQFNTWTTTLYEIETEWRSLDSDEPV